MTYLATFHWGWLTAALLLGVCIGWGAGGQRRPGRFENHGALACGAGRHTGGGGAGPPGAGPPRLLARSWPRPVRGLPGWLRDRVVAARSGGFASRNRRLRRLSPNCSKTVHWLMEC